jgi:hypothetical protein
VSRSPNHDPVAVIPPPANPLREAAREVSEEKVADGHLPGFAGIGRARAKSASSADQKRLFDVLEGSCSIRLPRVFQPSTDRYSWLQQLSNQSVLLIGA